MSDIIREEIDFSLIENEVEEIQEGVGKKMNFFIKGPFLQAEIKNGNKRIYPRAIIEREVNTRLESLIKENRACGELGHPPSSEINLDRISHVIKEMKMEGNTAFGKAEILDNLPCGKIARGLMERGVKLGVSSRGVGTLKNGIVQSDYRLITVDIVSTPSGPECFVDGILECQKEWVLENGILIEKEIEQIEDEKEKIVTEHKFSKEDKEAAFMKLFQDTLDKIAKKK